MTFLRKLSFLLFLCLLAFSSCKKDQSTDDDIIITPTPDVIVNGSVSGLVTDEDGNALANTEIRVGVHSIMTDENGIFTFKNIQLKEKGELITAEKEGYFYNAKFIRPNLNKMGYTRIMMIEKTLSGTFQAASGGTVTTNGDASIDFPANGIKLEGGGAYNGNVNVYATWLDPTADDLFLRMPGDLRGTNAEEQQVQLVTYGMIGVELESDAGEALNLADGQTATIELPVPADLQGSAPSTIPLWHFDEATGYWVEDGTATLQGGKYVGTVSHFSFWNCDDPNFFIDLSGNITDEGLAGIQGLLIEIENNSNGAVGYGYTNEDGDFGGFVPINENLTIRVYDYCGEEIYSADIGPFSEDTELASFAVTATSTFVTFSGNVTDCDDNAVSNGYVKVDFGTTYQVIQLEADGSFNATLSVCNETEVDVSAYDLNAFTQSDATTHDIDGLTALDLGTIQACDADITEVLTISFDGGITYTTFIDPSATLTSGNILNVFAWDNSPDSTLVEFTVQASAIGTYNPDWFTANVFDGGNFFFGSCQGCPDLEVTIDEWTDVVGEVVEGTFDGDVQGSGGIVNVSGTFKALLE